MDKLKLAIHHTHHEDEQLGPDSTAMELDEGPRVREAARERGLAPRTDGSTTLNLSWAQLHEMLQRCCMSECLSIVSSTQTVDVVTST